MLVNGYRVFHFYRITNRINYLEFASKNNVKKQIIMIVNIILNIIFIISELMQIVERIEIDNLIKIQTDQLSILQLKLRKHFHHYLCYTVVSISNSYLFTFRQIFKSIHHAHEFFENIIFTEGK